MVEHSVILHVFLLEFCDSVVVCLHAHKLHVLSESIIMQRVEQENHFYGNTLNTPAWRMVLQRQRHCPLDRC